MEERVTFIYILDLRYPKVVGSSPTQGEILLFFYSGIIEIREV